MKLQDTIRRILREEVAEYARTLKNARRQGSGLRFPKSAIKANPNRFRPYSREQVDEMDSNTEMNKVYDMMVKRKEITAKTYETNESDPKIGTGKKPKDSSRRLYTDENPKDTVSVKFRTKEDIVDTLNKESFKSKPHKRQSQIINLIHQRVRAAYENAKDPETKKRLKRAYDYIETQKEKSKQKTIRLQKESIDKKIKCQCGWSWNLKDGGNDPYTCHKCGHNNSKKYIKEEKEELLNESIKEKLTNLLDKEGLAETLNILKIDIDKLSSMMGISMEELMQKHNPFKNIFSDKEFEEELNESIKFLTKKHFLDHLRNESLDGILSFLINNVIDSFHHKLIDFNTEDWIIPETPKLIKMIYGDRIKNHPNYNKWLRFIINK